VSRRRTFTGLLNTLKAHQGVLEHNFPRGILHPFEERKGIETLEVRAGRSSGRIRKPCVGILQGVQRSGKPFKVSELEKLKEEKYLCKECTRPTLK
jgi:hypothetical protein